MLQSRYNVGMNTTFSANQTFSLASGVIVTQVDGESVLLDSKNGQYFGLNDTGTQILQLIERQKYYSAICEELAKTYPDNHSEINTDVSELLSSLLSKKLITSQ